MTVARELPQPIRRLRAKRKTGKRNLFIEPFL
jgi:hypothetical protein